MCTGRVGVQGLCWLEINQHGWLISPLSSLAHNYALAGNTPCTLHDLPLNCFSSPLVQLERPLGDLSLEVFFLYVVRKLHKNLSVSHESQSRREWEKSVQQLGRNLVGQDLIHQVQVRLSDKRKRCWWVTWIWVSVVSAKVWPVCFVLSILKTMTFEFWLNLFWRSICFASAAALADIHPHPSDLSRIQRCLRTWRRRCPRRRRRRRIRGRQRTPVPGPTITTSAPPSSSTPRDKGFLVSASGLPYSSPAIR